MVIVPGLGQESPLSFYWADLKDEDLSLAHLGKF